MPVIATDFGGTKIKLGVVDNGRIIAATSVTARAEESIENNLEYITTFLRTFLKQQNINRDSISGFGMALPVIVDSEQNRVLTEYVKYKDAKGFDFNNWFKQNWGVTLQLENDARAALVGEWKYGAGKNCNNIVMLTLGTGVGSAVITNGKLLKGAHYMAGNMTGHTTINADGVACNCGSTGCLESEASTWALPEIAKRFDNLGNSPLANKNNLDFNDLITAIENGDELANKIFKHCVNIWGIAAANLVHSFDPERIIVSGGIMKSASKILPVLEHSVDKRTWLEPGTVKVVAAEQVDFAALLGLAYLLKDKVS